MLAVFSENRLPGQLADVPTTKEQGYNTVRLIICGHFVGPKVTDAEYQWWVDTFAKAKPGFKKKKTARSARAVLSST